VHICVYVVEYEISNLLLVLSHRQKSALVAIYFAEHLRPDLRRYYQGVDVPSANPGHLDLGLAKVLDPLELDPRYCASVE